MTITNPKSQSRILNEMVDGITQAAGACSQLIHTMQDPRWMTIREMLELTKEGMVASATYAAKKINVVKH